MQNRQSKNRFRWIAPLCVVLCGNLLTVIRPSTILAEESTAAIQSARAINAANQQLRDGDLEGAIKSYGDIEGVESFRSQISYNLGVAHYRKGDLESAANAFQQAVDSDDDKLAAQSRFNLGNCRYAAALKLAETDKASAVEQLQNAIENFRAALRIDRENEDARANIELASRLMDQLERELQQEQQQNQNQQQQEDQQQKNDSKNENTNSDQSDSNDSEQGEQQEQQQAPNENSQNPKQQQQSDPSSSSQNQQQPSEHNPSEDPEQEQSENSAAENQSETEQSSNENESEQSANKRDDSNSNGEPDSNSDNPSENQEQNPTNNQNNEDPSGERNSDEMNSEDEMKAAQGNQENDNAKDQVSRNESDETGDERSSENEDTPMGELKAANRSDEKGSNKPAYAAIDPNATKGKMTREEALKMLQAVRDRDMLRRLRNQQRERARRVPVDKDW